MSLFEGAPAPQAERFMNAASGLDSAELLGHQPTTCDKPEQAVGDDPRPPVSLARSTRGQETSEDVREADPGCAEVFKSTTQQAAATVLLGVGEQGCADPWEHMHGLAGVSMLPFLAHLFA